MPKRSYWLSTKEVSIVLGISRSAVYALLRRGELPHYRFGRRIRIALPALAEYVSCHLNRPPHRS